MYSNPNLTDAQVSTALDDKHEGHKSNPISMLAKNPAVKGENLDKVFNKITKDPNSYDMENLTNNPNLQDHHVTGILKTAPEYKTRLALNKNIHFSPENQKTYAKENKINHYDSDLSYLAARRDLSPETIDHIAKGDDDHAVRHLISNPDVQLSKEHIESILKNHDKDGDTSRQLFNSHHEEANNRSDELLDKIINSPKSRTVFDISKSRMFNKEHLAKMIDKGDEKGQSHIHAEAARSNKLSSEQIHHLIDKNKDSSNVQGYLLNNNKLKPEHLQKLVTNPKITDSAKHEVLRHPAANAQVLHDVYDTGNVHDKNAVLHHPDAQLSHFTKALNETGFKLHGAISSAPGAPPSVLHKMSESPLSFVRQNVASHKNTSQETLKNLKSDSNEQVAATAAKRYKGQ